ncbi:MAG TPA: hypothetical protein VFM54_19025 [Micromonosporaceae bacterium]|nr:hypothetical protein [Micromonosporaceae bacterium]
MLAFGAGWPVGALAGGLLSEAYGPRATLWLAAGMVAVACVVAWTALPGAGRHPAGLPRPAPPATPDGRRAAGTAGSGAPATTPDGRRAAGAPELGARTPASGWLTDMPESAGEERAWPDESRR